MNHMKFESPDMTAQNIDRIAALFPNCVTETSDGHGGIKRAINFELLKQMLSPDMVDGDERYEFTWVGKKAAIVEANKPIRKTLRPCMEESKNWDTTENLYIEGDNLEVLKLLQESYLGKVKMIYIDPPYNTGNDFIYADDFMRSQEEENEQMGMYDEDENRLFKNTDTNGRFHSDWCSMMYSRLMLARNMLSNDGVIFISIDENEIETLTKICDEVFGEVNHVGTIIVKSNPRGSMSTLEIASLHEYLLIYSKSRSDANIIGHELSAEMTSEYKHSDEVGAYRLLGLRMRGGFWRRSDRPNLFFPIYVNPADCSVSLEKSPLYCEVALPVQPSTMEDGTWRWSKEKILVESKLLVGKKITRGNEFVWDIYQKDYLERDSGRRTKAKSIWDDSEINYQNGASEIKELFGKGGIFDYSKPTFLIKQAMKMIGFDYDSSKQIRVGSSVKYDLIGKLVGETGLTRKAVVAILTGIEKPVFEQFKFNPEEFIIKAAALINDEKATAIIQHITYNVLDEHYDTDIFTEPTIKGKLGTNAMKAQRHLYDHIVYDSTNERNFAADLDTNTDVAVYVKLPDSFYIATPVGHYNPDWAIAFYEGTVKHIYFVAETKGSMSSMQLRLIEESKIHCAREHFKAISSGNVVYDVVDSYQTLLERVMK